MAPFWEFQRYEYFQIYFVFVVILNELNHTILHIRPMLRVS